MSCDLELVECLVQVLMDCLMAIGDHKAVHVRAITMIKYSEPSQRKLYLCTKSDFELIKENSKEFNLAIATFVTNTV